MNQVILQGNLGTDGELRYTQGGKALLRLRLATEESYQDDSGQWQSRPEWHTVIVWDKKAENLAQRCARGRPLLVVGRLRTRKYEDKDGNERSTTEVVAKSVSVFSGYAPRAEAAQTGTAGQRERGTDELGDDIPF